MNSDARETLLNQLRTLHGLSDEEWLYALAAFEHVSTEELQDDVAFFATVVAETTASMTALESVLREREEAQIDLLKSPVALIASWINESVRSWLLTGSPEAFLPFADRFGIRESIVDDWMHFYWTLEPSQQFSMGTAAASACADAIFSDDITSAILIEMAESTGRLSDVIAEVSSKNAVFAIEFFARIESLRSRIYWKPAFRNLGNTVGNPWYLSIQRIDSDIEQLFLDEIVTRGEVEALCLALVSRLGASIIERGLQNLTMNKWKRTAFSQFIENMPLVAKYQAKQEQISGITVPGQENQRLQLLALSRELEVAD